MAVIEDLVKTKPIKDPYHRSLTNILYTGSWITNKINLVLKSSGLTEPQYNVLRILRGSKGEVMNLYEIQDRMIQKMSNVSRLVDKLEEKGYVHRKECEDNRRRVDIEITSKGMELLNTLDEPFRKIYKDISKTMTKEEAEMLSSLLDKMRYD